MSIQESVKKQKTEWFLECVKFNKQSLRIFLRGWKARFIYYLVTIVDSWFIGCNSTDFVWPCPYLSSATGCQASASFRPLCNDVSDVWREGFLLSLGSVEHAKVSTWEEQSLSVGVCLMQIERGSKEEAVSLQTSIKSIPRGIFTS